MDAAVSGKDRAKALAPFGPVHGLALEGVRDGFSRIKLIMGSRKSQEIMDKRLPEAAARSTWW
jgi:hypothetical protein